MKTYMCIICGFIYSEKEGIPGEGIEPGTSWQEIPESWTCPDCGMGKSDFILTEI
ncbi:rubredoxin [Iodobacter sp. HSC-16F04]|uniref:Rubredoxin n=2 Tax=Iodobacter violaceini TaxID=3044271 RepID=A0ABX0KR65_9NEIS|nr:rubredoxin [Iodobacter violacea]NHQ84552.1 rubredoxin [Iodobacter violacea]